jgi:Ca2+-transporting ATPase
LLIGGLAFGNYLLFFQRHGLNAEFIRTGSHVHMQATALTYLTIVLCQLGNILQRRSQEGLFTKYQFQNWHLWGAIGLSLSCVLAIIYSPLHSYFGAAPLALTDWLFALSAATIFLGVRELQRHLRIKKPAAITAGSSL